MNKCMLSWHIFCILPKVCLSLWHAMLHAWGQSTQACAETCQRMSIRQVFLNPFSEPWVRMVFVISVKSVIPLIQHPTLLFVTVCLIFIVIVVFDILLANTRICSQVCDVVP